MYLTRVPCYFTKRGTGINPGTHSALFWPPAWHFPKEERPPSPLVSTWLVWRRICRTSSGRNNNPVNNHKHQLGYILKVLPGLGIPSIHCSSHNQYASIAQSLCPRALVAALVLAGAFDQCQHRSPQSSQCRDVSTFSHTPVLTSRSKTKIHLVTMARRPH